MHHRSLFEPVTLGSHTLKNRIVMPAQRLAAE